jgi:hypothetical protein
MTKNKLTSLAIMVTVFSLLATVVANWYLQNKVENFVEDITKQLSPVAVIKYEDTDSSLWNSSVGVEQLTINPRAVRGEVKIERIDFHAPNLKFLLDAEAALEKGDIPEKMRITVDNLSISTEGNIARSLAKSSSSSPMGARDKAYACADVERFGFYELAEMGYEQLSIDLDISYEYDSRYEKLNLSALWTNRQMFELALSSLFDVQKSRFKLNQTKHLFKQMSSLKMTYSDLGLNRKTIDYCNLQRGDQGYVSDHIEAFKQDLSKQFNITPSNRLVEAYRSFMLESGVIEISSNMPQAINPDYLGLYSPEDIILLLRPDITVNGQAMDLPFDELLKDSRATESVVAKSSKKSQAVTVSMVAGSPDNKPKYVKVSLTELAGHIGDMVRVETKQGGARTGMLIATSESRIKVEVNYRGGTAIYPIFINNIANTEVMELPPTGAQ